MSARRPRVAVTRVGLPGDAVARLAASFDLACWPGRQAPSAAELRELAAGADAMLCVASDQVGADLLASAPRLRVVALASSGFDAVDVAGVRAAGVVATHAPGVLHETTADLTFALILMARRRLVAAMDAMRRGEWTENRMDGFLGLDVHGSVLGILGFGQIGQAVARRGRAFGMRVQHHGGRTPGGELSRAVGLEDLLRTSDVLSVHVPLTATTRNLLGAAQLALMKPSATLVNAARGGVVDEDALLAALRAGSLHSAALDVFAGEPRHDPADPLFAQQNLVVLPHLGSATHLTRSRMVDLAARNIEAVLAGAPALTPIPGSAAVPGTPAPSAPAPSAPG